MKFGIIGFGRMGKAYHQALSSMKIEIGFICDIVKPEIDIKYHSDYKRALEELQVDGLIISTYGPSHYEIVRMAIEKKIKFIICEKPFTTSVKHADEIINKLKNSDTRLTINYGRRYSNVYSDLKKNIIDGVIGKPSTMIITCGAGGLSTVGTHFFDLCSFILGGKIRSVFAVPVNKNLPNPRGKEFEDPGGYVVLSYDNESRAYIDMGDDLGVQHLIEIIGEYGRIIIDETNETILIRSRSLEDRKKPKHLYGLPNNIIKNESFKLESMSNLIQKMISEIISESNSIVIPEIARDSVNVYSAIRKSYDTKQPVDFPLQDEYYEKEFMVT